VTQRNILYNIYSRS